MAVSKFYISITNIFFFLFFVVTVLQHLNKNENILLILTKTLPLHFITANN